MNHFSATVLRNSAFGLAAQLATKVLSFAFNVLVIRQLGATDFGQYAAVGAFGTLFLFIADLGLSPYAVREFARWRDAFSRRYGVKSIRLHTWAWSFSTAVHYNIYKSLSLNLAFRHRNRWFSRKDARLAQV